MRLRCLIQLEGTSYLPLVRVSKIQKHENLTRREGHDTQLETRNKD